MYKTTTPRSNIYAVLKTFSFFKIHVDVDFLFPRGLLFFAGNLVPRGFWEREAFPVLSAQSALSEEMLHFVGKTLRCQNIWTLPWFLPLERFVLRFVAVFDNPYDGVAANRWNVWLR